MAFQLPTVQTLTAATTDIWPSMSAMLSMPLSGARIPGLPGARRSAQVKDGKAATVESPTRGATSKAIHQPNLPDCLQSVTISSLRPTQEAHGLTKRYGVQDLISTVDRHGIIAISPLAHRFSTPPGVRSYSTFRPFGIRSLRRIPQINQDVKTSTRNLFASSTSRNLLAHMEQTANNNPQSATAQNAFYAALLRANMPEIVVERYQSGRYATNTSCEATYLRSLEKVGQSEKARAISDSKAAEGQTGALSSEQLQAIGQAVAAQSRGGNLALARGKNGTFGSGAKESPLYVVVEETIGGTIFKWVRFLFYFGLCTYIALVLITVAVEATGILKKVGGVNTNEAQPEHQTTRFSDVHGCEEAKEELQEIVEFLKNPEKFNALGGKLPKGVLLVGPPGTGKTLLARAVAGEAGVPFFFMSGSEFDEVYVGVGAKRVRELFNAARAKAPAIVFIDELDAIGGKRNERDAAYVKQTLNQLLTDLDGFAPNSGVIFLAATNFPQLLDKALTRPGRFDRNVVVPLPDVRGRIAILNHHMRNVQIGSDVDAAVIARGTPGFSGAELENIVNQAAVRASRNKQKKVSMLDFEWAKDKVLMGAERRSAVIQMKDKQMTAYHEGGHALVAMFTEGADPLYKATIMPRGQALGITFQLPELDKVSLSMKELIAHIDICMGGKVAEEIVYGAENVTTGASSDIQKATQLAKQMVTQMGMSTTLGNVDLESDYNKLSPHTKEAIELEVKRIIDESYGRATKLLTKKRKELDTLAKALVEFESLSREEMEKVVRGEKIEKVGISGSHSKSGGQGPQDEKDKEPDRIPVKLPDVLLPPGMHPPKGAAGASERRAINDGSHADVS